MERCEQREGGAHTDPLEAGRCWAVALGKERSKKKPSKIVEREKIYYFRVRNILFSGQKLEMVLGNR